MSAGPSLETFWARLASHAGNGPNDGASKAGCGPTRLRHVAQSASWRLLPCAAGARWPWWPHMRAGQWSVRQARQDGLSSWALAGCALSKRHRVCHAWRLRWRGAERGGCEVSACALSAAMRARAAGAVGARCVVLEWLASAAAKHLEPADWHWAASGAKVLAVAASWLSHGQHQCAQLGYKCLLCAALRAPGVLFGCSAEGLFL